MAEGLDSHGIGNDAVIALDVQLHSCFQVFPLVSTTDAVVGSGEKGATQNIEVCGCRSGRMGQGVAGGDTFGFA